MRDQYFWKKNLRLAGKKKEHKIRKGTKKRDTVNYTLCKNNKRVYEGVTFADRAKERSTEHKRSGKDFDKMCCDKPTTRAVAYKEERRRIDRFKPPLNNPDAILPRTG